MSELFDVLRSIPVFDGLDPAVVERLAGRCVPRDVHDGFVLFRAGDRCAGLYIVLEGRVRIFRTSPDGREQTIAVEGPGRPIAELPLFDGGPYPATAITTTPGRLAFLPRGEFEQAFRTDPDVAASVVYALGGRLRHMVQLIETLAFRDVAARLAMVLADLAERQGTPRGDHVVLVLDRTQEALAAEIGTARESVSRALKSLKQRGLIRAQSGSRLEVVAPDRLRSWARGGGP